MAKDLKECYRRKKESSIVRGIGFSLSYKKYSSLMRTKKCYYTNTKFVDIDNHPNQRSIDRIDSKKGYTDKNTIACTRDFNSRKGGLSIKEMKKVINLYEKLNPKPIKVKIKKETIFSRLLKFKLT